MEKLSIKGKGSIKRDLPFLFHSIPITSLENGLGNDKQLELNACMFPPAPVRSVRGHPLPGRGGRKDILLLYNPLPLSRAACTGQRWGKRWTPGPDTGDT